MNLVGFVLDGQFCMRRRTGGQSCASQQKFAADGRDGSLSTPDEAISRSRRVGYASKAEINLKHWRLKPPEKLAPAAQPSTLYLPGGLYAPRSSVAFFRMWVTSSCVNRRVSFTL
jgi:hypothetical protein